MQKPTNYDTTQAGGDFTPVELGGHLAIIKNVSERETKNGDPMIVVSIDFDKKDAQAGYFTEQFKKDVRPDKKYPNQAVNYITTEYGGACTKGFKSFMKAYCDSNGISEDKIKWGSDFATQFKNKKIGVVYGAVEELYNGEVKKRRKIRWFCDYAKALDQPIPAEKLLDEKDKPAAPAQTNTDDFMNVPEGSDEEIPFE
jgi:hypothetical protein